MLPARQRIAWRHCGDFACRVADNILRGEQWVSVAPQPRSMMLTLGLLLGCGSCYGALMGAYPFTWEETRPLQMLYSGLKVPLLLVLSFALSVPSFYVANLLLGLGNDFGIAFRAVLATQAALTITLFSLAPITTLFYISGATYEQALMVNSLMFGISSLGVQPLLRRQYRSLIERNPWHRWTMRVWIVIYAFVGIQMGWVLRPFVGSPNSPTQFFRDEAWGNAYLAVWGLVKHVLGIDS